MALFGRSRDISLFRHINRELLGNIITQQVAFYKWDIVKTDVDIYGESSTGKIFSSPTLLNCLIVRNDNTNPINEFGISYERSLQFNFLRDDLTTANLLPEIGDVILYLEDYYEIESIIENQLFVGKDPNYPYSTNPLNPGLEEFGSSISINCIAHYVPADKFSITKERM